MEIFSVSPRQFQVLDSATIRNAVSASIQAGTVRKMMAELGIGMDGAVEQQLYQYAMDTNLVAPLTTASISTPIQFLQHWLPGIIEVITAARKIDDLVGISMNGSWHQEEIVQQIIEYTGATNLYGDYTNVPLSNWNMNYERRSIVRFEEGMQVGRLEEARASEIRVSSADAKRSAAATSLEIQRNKLGFLGFNSGNNRTYGFLNDPNLPAYVTVANGASTSPLWSTKTFAEIVADLTSAIVALRTQSKERIDPAKDSLTLAVATACVDRLSTPSTQIGFTVWQWMKENYPNIRVVSAPELDAANGGANVFYLYADTVRDSGSDDQRTFIQPIQSKFMTLGVEQRTKSYLEDYTNASAGVFVKRPYAIVRRSGI